MRRTLRATVICQYYPISCSQNNCDGKTCQLLPYTLTLTLSLSLTLTLILFLFLIIINFTLYIIVHGSCIVLGELSLNILF